MNTLKLAWGEMLRMFTCAVKYRRQQGKRGGTEFERDLIVALRDAQREGIIHGYYRIPNGNRYMGGKTIADHKTPADFAGWLPGGKALIFEAKDTNGKSIPVKFMDANNKYEGAGLKEHQLYSLIEASESGAIGLLIVQFGDDSVMALDGLGLRQWLDGGDEKGNAGSISLQHFQEWGVCLGTRGNWRFDKKVLGK